MADDVPKVAHPTTYMETMMHLLKGSVGTGLFAMGDGFKNTGLLLGIVLLLIVSLICLYAEHQLLNAATQLKELLNLDVEPDFPGTVELAFSTGPENLHKFGHFLRKLTFVIICITQLGFCCVYIVFCAASFQQVLEYFDFYMEIHIIMVLVIIPITLTCLIRNLKYLAPVSLIANILLFVSAAMCLYYASLDLPPISERPLVADLKKVPLAFGTFLFALVIIGLVLPVRSEMAKPESFNSRFGVLNIGSFIFITLYIIMGFLSYLKWGDEIQGSVTLQLDETELVPQLIKMATAFAIMFTYAIQYYVAFVILWPAVCSRYGPFGRPLFMEMCFRVFLVLLTFFLAETIPFLNLLISLVGSLTSSIVALLIPPILEYVMCKRMSTVTTWIIIKNGLIFVVGLAGTITGTYMSVHSIIVAFKNATTDYNILFSGVVIGQKAANDVMVKQDPNGSMLENIDYSFLNIIQEDRNITKRI